MNKYLTIDEFGGSSGLRDRGGLEAALARPRTGYYSNIYEESAALMEIRGYLSSLRTCF